MQNFRAVCHFINGLERTKTNCLQRSVADTRGRAAIDHLSLNKTLINIQSVCHHTWLRLLVLQNYKCQEAENFNEQKNEARRVVHKKPFQIPLKLVSHPPVASTYFRQYRELC